MSYKLTFGKYEGKTFEWLFFRHLSYVQWIYENGIHRQEHFGEEQADEFMELHRRASHLGGTCCRCHERPVTRMGLTTSFRHGELLAVGFYCDACEYLGGARTGYYLPSFFVDAYDLESWEQKMVISEIKRHYIGPGNLTQSRMETFFVNDENFSRMEMAA